MLKSLAIRDVVLIERLDLEFHSQLCVLTGETGAGKSILLDALGLALGARGDAALVRRAANGADDSGKRQAAVTAVFDTPGDDDIAALMEEYGLTPPEPGEVLILRRVLGEDGRSRAFINDQPVGIALLRAIGERLVEIESQFAAQRLTDGAAQRAALDGFAALDRQARAVAELWEDWAKTRAALAEADATVEAAKREEETLRLAYEELTELAPEPGEETVLAGERTALMHAEKLIDALNDADGALNQGDGVEAALRRASRILERAAEKAGGGFDAAIAALDRANIEAAEATEQLALAARAIEINPARLEQTEQRLFALRAAARKYRVAVEELPALADRYAAELAALEDGAGRRAALAEQAAQARTAYLSEAAALSTARAKAAAALDRAIMAELAPLKLDKARFETRVERLGEADWGPGGLDRVRFEVATNPGAAPGPIGKIASGGELARFLLALKVALASAGSAPTLVFDEVDAGVGGATAAAVGERLAALAARVQVLVVTHSPQVAARAQHHWRVAKSSADDSALTEVSELTPDARREEIARMLAGAQITEEARAAAARLIAGDGQ